tara:strand:- start:18 stop:716 length:699 start_codon:yes stop_codon:yes gene_type:complete
MAIPKIVTPTYECELPSTKQKIKYRPFLVKEEKVMLVALESDDDNAIADAMVQIINNCVLSPNIDVSKLPIFDFEYLYLKVRAKSVGEIVNLKLKCPDDEKELVDHALNIDEIQVIFDPEHKLEVPFTKDYGVLMKYPTIRDFKDQGKLSELSFDMFKSCLQMIYKGDETYERNNITKEELDEWIDTLTPEQYKKITQWFSKIPKLDHTISYTNPKSGKDFKLRLQGVKDFF